MRPLLRAIAPLLVGLSLLAPQVSASGAAPAVRKHVFKGLDCELLAAPYATTGSCGGVRPGALVYSNIGRCTMNFVFKGTDRYTYVGTAGHCILRGPGETTWKGYNGPSAAARGRAYFGNFAYAVLNSTKDFALIRLARGVRWSAKMCHFGGPDGLYAKQEPLPEILKHFGNGEYYGQNLPARTAIAENTLDRDIVVAHGFAGHGDSGSGVINDMGEAIGVLVAISLPAQLWQFQYTQFGIVPPLNSGVIITRIDAQVARAQKMLRTRLAIQSAPVSSDLEL